ncbi:MAG: ATP-grasp domain-containing protein [Candidatus Bipolaricaulia bacterium]
MPRSTRQRNVFILGYNEADVARLQRLPHAETWGFHPALHLDEMRGVETFAVDELIERAADRMAAVTGGPDGIVAFFDFPATTMLPILAERFGLPGPDLTSVLKCEHKYWSRREQRQAIPDHTPQFRPFDPCAAQSQPTLPLEPPFWIKPIKSFRSYLGFLVNDELEFRRYAAEMCEHLVYVVEPFVHILRNFHMPDDIAHMRESCLAESLIGGAQCTAEGYVDDRDVVVYGVVDSVREPNRSSFQRFEYPSSLPTDVQHRMAEIARRLVQRIGLRQSCFNAEFFWNPNTDQIWLLEINPRPSQSHAALFERVHGASHQRHMLDLAVGHRPTDLPNAGRFKRAAKCFIRVYQSGRVRRVPSDEEIERLQAELPGTSVEIHVAPGQHLDELTDQDSYSYEVGYLVVGADDEADLLETYETALERLTFEIERSDRSLDLPASS